MRTEIVGVAYGGDEKEGDAASSRQHLNICACITERPP